MTQAGKLSERLTFLARPEIDDGAGNTEGPLAVQFSRWAEVRLRPGSEAFQQSRVQGAVPADVRVRRDSDTARIATDWVAEDARGVRWNIAAPVADPLDRGMIAFTMMAGRATG